MPPSHTRLKRTLEAARQFQALGETEDRQVVVPRRLLDDLISLAVANVFCEDFYTKTYRDVGVAIKDGHFPSGLNHYVKLGLYEARVPFDIPLDEANYLTQHNDVKSAIQRGEFSGAKDHFVRIGYAEGRSFTLHPIATRSQKPTFPS